MLKANESTGIQPAEFSQRRQRALDLARRDGLQGLLVFARGGGTLDRYADVYYLTNFYTPYPFIPDLAGNWSARAHTSFILPTDADPGLQGFWRTVPWDKAQDVAGKAPARIEGVPVEEVQVQPSRVGGSPMMVVAQRLSSGEVIQTIEGPTADVSQLLSRRGDGGLDSAGRPAEAMQRGDRMLVVTGELPSDSLRAMVRRVNAAMRVR